MLNFSYHYDFWISVVLACQVLAFGAKQLEKYSGDEVAHRLSWLEGL